MPRVLISRSQLRPLLRVREVRLAGVTNRILRQLQQLVTPQELRVGAGIGSIHPAPLAQRITGVWDRYRGELVRALEDPVRAQKAEDDPFAGAPFDDSLAAAQVGRLIQELAGAQVAAVQIQLQTLMQLGPTPETLAGIGAATGLTRRQVALVAAYLKRQQEAGLADAVIERTTRSYADTLLRQRAGTIAQHEAATYTNAIVHARGEQLNAGGTITKAWVSSRDPNVDRGNPFGICRVLDNGQRVPLTQAWVFEGERIMSPPGHIRCRCLEEIWDEAA
jgi:hypothetical protein